MADSTSKSTAGKPRKRATGKSPNGSSPKAKSTRAKPKSTSRATRSSGSANASKQRSRPASEQSSGQEEPSQVGQAVGTVKQAAGKVAGPALAVGAAAAAVAGGVLLRGRRRKTVLGVPVPRSFGKPHLPDLDVKSIAKTVGEASEKFAKTSKSVSQDLERAGERAERIGKILR
jgi:hypothetical protein